MRTLLVLAIAMLPGVAYSQEPTREPAFEVVSIRPSQRQGLTVRQTPDGSVTMVNVPIRFLVTSAYPEYLDVIGLPDWTATEYYDVLGRAPEGPEPTPEQRRAMIRGLLADRLGMRAHVESREADGFELVVAGREGALGPRLERSDLECVDSLDLVLRDLRDTPLCPTRMSGSRFEGETTLAAFARFLTGLLGQPVEDRTGLNGAFRITFESSSQPFTGATVEGLPSVFTALGEQLGLRAQPIRAAVDVLVIDSIERPTAN